MEECKGSHVFLSEVKYSIEECYVKQHGVHAGEYSIASLTNNDD